MVADSAPRLFAVVQEYGDRVHGWVEAWGLAFEDHVDVVGVEGGPWMCLSSPERAMILFTHRPHVTARVMWVNPDTVTPTEGDEAA